MKNIKRELAGIREQLDIVQDAVEETIQRALQAIRAKLDELDRDAEGFGADLLITTIRHRQPGRYLGRDRGATVGGGAPTVTWTPTPNRSTPPARSCSPFTSCSPHCWPLPAEPFPPEQVLILGRARRQPR